MMSHTGPVRSDGVNSPNNFCSFSTKEVESWGVNRGVETSRLNGLVLGFSHHTGIP